MDVQAVDSIWPRYSLSRPGGMDVALSRRESRRESTAGVLAHDQSLAAEEHGHHMEIVVNGGQCGGTAVLEFHAEVARAEGLRIDDGRRPTQ